MALTLVWPAKKPLVTTAPPQPTPQYYYIDDVAGEEGKKDSFRVSLAFANPAKGTIDKQQLQTTWPLAGGPTTPPIQLTSDGTSYAYATIDQAVQSGPADSVSFQLITGTWPQQKSAEKVLFADTKHADPRDWLLTKDGKEIIVLDVPQDNTQTVARDLYAITTSDGKRVKIGAIDRPANRENTPLHEYVKDKTVRYYTSQDDGIYETRYDRTTRTVAGKKVVIRDYDLGAMGPTSPDGTKMLYFGSSATTNTVYLLDLVEGGATPLISTPFAYGGYRSSYWSPDSKSIVVTTEIKDVDGKRYENQLLRVDTTVKSTEGTTMLLRNKSPGADNSTSLYTVMGWSPDGTYVTYMQNKRLYFYDLHAGKTRDTIHIDHDLDPHMTVTGWIGRPV